MSAATIKDKINVLINGDSVYDSVNKPKTLFRTLIAMSFLTFFHIVMPWGIIFKEKFGYDNVEFAPLSLVARLMTPLVLVGLASVLLLAYWLKNYKSKTSSLMTALPPIAMALALAFIVTMAASALSNTGIRFRWGYDLNTIQILFYRGMALLGIIVPWFVLWWTGGYFIKAFRTNSEQASLIFSPVFFSAIVWLLIFIFITGYNTSMMLISLACMPVIGLFAWLCAKYPPLLVITLNIIMAFFAFLMILTTVIGSFVGGIFNRR